MFKSILFFLVLGMLPFALSAPGPSPVEIICTTMLGDELQASIANAIELFRESPDGCRQTTPTIPPNESECTTLLESDEGITVLMCGPEGVRWLCDVIATALEKVVLKCPKKVPKKPGNDGGEYIIHIDGGNINFKLSW